MASQRAVGVISASEAYSKTELMLRLNISQKFWDKMLNDGLPVAQMGHAKWVTGQNLIAYLDRTAGQKNGQDIPTT